jgi:hypothetical protein
MMKKLLSMILILSCGCGGDGFGDSGLGSELDGSLGGSGGSRAGGGGVAGGGVGASSVGGEGPDAGQGSGGMGPTGGLGAVGGAAGAGGLGGADAGGSTGATGSGGGMADAGGSMADAGGGMADAGGAAGMAGSDSGALGSGGMAGSGGASGSGGAPGECLTGETRCSGAQRQTCVSGIWLDNGAACEGWCLDGTCVECVPGSRACHGFIFIDNQPKVCDATGAWVLGPECSGTTPLCREGVCVACDFDGSGCPQCPLGPPAYARCCKPDGACGCMLLYDGPCE